MSCGNTYCVCKKCRTKEPTRRCKNRGLKCVECGVRAHASSQAAKQLSETRRAKMVAHAAKREAALWEEAAARDAAVAKQRADWGL